MRALVIDLGGTHANCAVVEDKTVHCSETVRTSGEGSLRETLPSLFSTLANLASRMGFPLGSFAGLALGFCGLVDHRNATVVATDLKYEDATTLDLRSWTKQELGLPLYLENDARLALLGEWYSGAGHGSNDLVMITLGTGIGGAAMIDGRLLVGKHFQAGCLGGHIAATFDGSECNCGAVGCAESEASGWALPRLCQRWPGFEKSVLQGHELNFENLFCAAEEGDEVAVSICEHCLKVWSTTAVSLIHAYDPERLIFGGGVMRRGESILPRIQDYVKQHAWTRWGTVQVCSAQLGNDAPLLGAVPLIAQRNGAK
jgi:glucokinase